jgi:hypothetical protein
VPWLTLNLLVGGREVPIAKILHFQPSPLKIVRLPTRCTGDIQLY